jgi:Tol biopolymer transport system component
VDEHRDGDDPMRPHSLLTLLLAGPLVVTAAAQSTHRVSVDSTGAQARLGGGGQVAISADGRITAFVSASDDLVSGDTNGMKDVFVHDDATGSTLRASVDSSGAQGNNTCGNPSLSADGRFVAFESSATNLVAGDTNVRLDVFVRDLLNGTTERVSVDSSGAEANGGSFTAAISSDGRCVAFTSSATNLVAGDVNACLDVFVHDRSTGTTERVSVDSAGGEGNADSQSSSLSGDGRFVVFTSNATNLVFGDTNRHDDVFVRDQLNGTTERVSVDSSGVQANRDSADLSASAISGDGRFVVFGSVATNLVPNDVNGVPDIFLRDRTAGTTERLSVNSNGFEANDDSFGPSISADGRFVAFYSWATYLVAGDGNGVRDVFVRDRGTVRTTRASVDSAGNEADSYSEAPAVSWDGQFIVFRSFAKNLVSGDTNSSPDVFVRDRGPLLPELTGVTPDLGSYDAATSVTVHGFNFQAGTLIDVRFAGQSATSVNVLDNYTLTCTIAGGPSGPATVAVQTSIGTGDLAGAFTFTPYLRLTGTPLLGASIALDYFCDPFDGVFAIAGVPPAISAPTPPFDGALCISPFTVLLVMPTGIWPFDDLTLVGTIPDDPNLSGATILFQALIGPSFTPPKHATWTNCEAMTIR